MTVAPRPENLALSSAADAPSPLGSPRPTWRVPVAIAVAAALASGGVLLGYQRWDAGVAAELEEAMAALSTSVIQIEVAIAAGQKAHDESAGRVADEQVREDLAAAIDTARELDMAVATDVPHQDRVTRARELVRQGEAHMSTLGVVLRAVEVAVAGWELELALADLTVALDSARVALTESDHMNDDAVPAVLAAAVEGIAALTRNAGSTAEELAASTAQARALIGVLQSAGAAAHDGTVAEQMAAGAGTADSRRTTTGTNAKRSAE